MRLSLPVVGCHTVAASKLDIPSHRAILLPSGVARGWRLWKLLLLAAFHCSSLSGGGVLLLYMCPGTSQAGLQSHSPAGRGLPDSGSLEA